MSGSSRKDSGAGSKGRYQTLNLAQNFYKGNSYDSKSAQKRGSMQSLGKIHTTTRRMPAPAQVRSLKSSNDGQDPSVTLVPQGGGGWSKDDEKEKEKEDPRNYTRKTEKPPDAAVPEGFKEDFPSLEEQEKMSKKEREELERRQREEENYDEESRNSPPPSPPPSSRNQHSRKPPPKEAWGGQDGPPYQHGHPYNMPHPLGGYPHRRDVYQHHQPYPPRPSAGGGYPPSGQHRHSNPHYRHSGPYPPPPPHNYPPHPMPPYLDPYSLPPDRGPVSQHDERKIHTPPLTAKYHLEEDDEGWAGHQEEVDYTKEVIFEDSSDDDSPKKANKEQKEEFGKKGKGQDLHRNTPDVYNEHSKEREQQFHRRPSPPGHHGNHPSGRHPPHPPYDYHRTHHPPYPPYPHYPGGGWYPPYQPRGGGDLPYAQDHGRPGRQPREDRGGRNNRRQQAWETERHWSKPREGEPPPGEAGRDEVPLALVSRGDNESPLESVGSDNRTDTPSGLLHTPSPDALGTSNVRSYPKKIMMRDLGDKAGGRDQTGQRSGEGGQDRADNENHKTKVAWATTATTTESFSLPLGDDRDLEKPPVPPVQTNTKEMYPPNERGPVNTPKTLYEPEGRASQEKFRKYQRSLSGGGGASDHHTHNKPRTSSNTSKSESIKGSGEDIDLVDQPGTISPEVFVPDEKKVVIRKSDGRPDRKSDDRNKDSNGRRNRDRGFRDDGNKQKNGRAERGGDRRRGSQKDEPVRHKPEKGQDSYKAQKRKPEDRELSETRNQDSSNGSGKPSLQKQNSKTHRPDSDKGVSATGSRNNTRTDWHDDSRGPERSSRPAKQHADTRQEGRGDTRPHPHQNQSRVDSRSQTRDQDPRTSLKPKQDQGSRQSSFNPQSREQDSKQASRREHKRKGPDESSGRQRRPNEPVSDQQSVPTNRQGTRNETRKVPGPSKQDINQDPILPPEQDHIPVQPPILPHSRQDPVTTRQDSIPPKQDPIPSRQDPVPFRKEPGPHVQETKHTRSHEQENKKNPKQDLVPPRQNPIPPGQDSVPSKQDPNLLKQSSRRDTRYSHGSSQRQESKRDTFRTTREPDSTHAIKQEVKQQDFLSSRQGSRPGPRQDPIPPKVESKQDSVRQNSAPSKPPDTVVQEKKIKTEANLPKTDNEYQSKRKSRNTKNSEALPSNSQNETDPSLHSKPDHGNRSSFGRRKQQFTKEDEEVSFDRPGTKRRLNTREREDSRRERDENRRGGRGGSYRTSRGGRSREYNDGYEGESPHLPRRNTKKEKDEDADQYPSRMFERGSKRGGHSRDHRKGREDVREGGDYLDEGGRRGDGDSKNEEQLLTTVYPDLDDIDSPSDWDEDEHDKPPAPKKSDSSVERSIRQEKGHRKWDQSHRSGRGQDRSRRGGRYPRKGNDEENPRDLRTQQRSVSSTNTKQEDPNVTTDKPDPSHVDPPTKDYNFEKYDINAHNVVVVDRRSSHSDGEGQSLGITDEGFIEVKSKRDKQKDRDEKRRYDGPQQKKGEDGSARQKGSSSRVQEHGHTGKGWGQVHQRKMDQLPKEGNEEWPINEGRSAYGAIGDKPSKEKGSSSNDMQKTSSLNSSAGYKLFDKGKTAPFAFEPPLPNSPRKGDRLQAAIDITLPSSPQITAHFESDRLVSNEQQQQQQQSLAGTNTSTTKVQLSDEPTKNKEQRSKSMGISDEPRPHVVGTKGDVDRRPRKPKSEQKFYTPPGARHDDRSSRGQRPHPSKHSSDIAPTHSKVHRKDSDVEVTMRQETDQHGNCQKEEIVYLQQHQDFGGHLLMGRNTAGKRGGDVSGDSVHGERTHPFNAIRNHNSNNQQKGQVLKELSSNRTVASSSSTKFGSVSYASALKMKGQTVKPCQEGVAIMNKEGVAIIEESAVSVLLSPKLSVREGLIVPYAEDSSGKLSIVNEGMLHEVLDSVLPNSDEELDMGSAHGYSPASHQSEEKVQPLYTVPGGATNTLSLASPSRLPFSPSVGGSAAAQSPLYSSPTMTGGSADRGGLEPSLSPTYPNRGSETKEQGGGGNMSMKKLLQEDTARPSSAQSLTDSPYSRFSKSSYTQLSGSESPTMIGKTSSGGPLTRVSSAPSHLPPNAMEDAAIDQDEDDTESVKTDDSLSTNSKSMLNIAANEFVPTRQLVKKKAQTSSQRYKDQQQQQQNRPSKGYQGGGGHRGKGNVPMQKGHPPHGKSHPTHFHQQHHRQQPHPPQQQALLNKPPIDLLLQFIMNASMQQQHKNVQSNLLLPMPGTMPPALPVPNVTLSAPQTPSHPSLPLNYPPMSGGLPFQVAHTPGLLSQSTHRKISQDGHPAPHAMPHPPLATPSAPALQYITAGSKVGGPIIPEGTPELTQVPMIPNTNHPSYFSVTPLHPSHAPPQLPTVLVPSHPVPVHHLPSTRPSHAPPITGPQVPPAVISSLPRPVIVEQQGNSNSRPPLLPTPPGFSLMHQTSTVSTPSVTTPPSLQHPNWPVHPQAIRLGLPPNIQSHDQTSLIQFPHLPPSN